MSHLGEWNEKIDQEGIKLTHEYNSNITKNGTLKGGKNKLIWIKNDQRNNEEYFPSGSDWNRDIISALNIGIYLCDIKYIIPKYKKEYTKNPDFFKDILNMSINEQNLKDKSWRKLNINHESAEIFYTNLELLLNESEEGDEEHTNDTVKAFLYALGLNRRKSPFVAESRHTFRFTIAGVMCTTKPDIIVFWNDRGIVVLFDESKRKKGSSEQQFYSQIACHSIAIAHNNMQNGKTQEVFGIAVKDKLWKFCHIIVSQDYLDALGDAEPMSKNIFVIQKISDISYNICNPMERKQLLYNILGILDYVFYENPKIGDYQNI